MPEGFARDVISPKYATHGGAERTLQDEGQGGLHVEGPGRCPKKERSTTLPASSRRSRQSACRRWDSARSLPGFDASTCKRFAAAIFGAALRRWLPSDLSALGPAPRVR